MADLYLSRLIACGVAVIVVHTGDARAQTATLAPAPVTRARPFAAALQQALQANDYRAALSLIESRPELAADPAAIRLRAQLLASLGRADDALSLLEARLSMAPDDALARFQLGEVHFNSRRDRPAELAYRLALAGDLDPARRDMVAGRLAAIRDRRAWQFSLGVSLAPDSNLNSGSSATTIQIYGLPFELDDAARQRGGVAASINVGVQRRFAISARDRLLVGIGGVVTDAPGGEFDSQYLSAQVGVERLVSPTSRLSVDVGSDWAWLRGERFQTLTGLRVGGQRITSPNTSLDISARAARVDDGLSSARDGWSYSLQASRTRYRTASTLTQTSLIAERRVSQADFESYWYGRLAHGWLLSGPFASAAYIEPYVAERRFDGVGLFGVARRDTEAGLGVRLSKRDWVFHGAFPFVALTLASNRSNVPLNTFSRQRFEFGLTRQF